MAHLSSVLLHVGYGLEMTLLEYLYRVLLHLLAFGTVVLVALRWSDVTGAVLSALPRRRSSEERDV